MKTLTQTQIENAVYLAACKVCFRIDNKVTKALESAYKTESKAFSKSALCDIVENITVASEKHIPVCQDTGIMIVFAEIGQELIINGNFEDAINNAIRRAYTDEYLRKSVVKSPIDRINTGDNTPAIIHYKLVSGDNLKLTLCPKGAGSENMGKVAMLTPADGENGIIDFVCSVVKSAGGKACPPLIVGVGIGGDMEKCAIMSKEALLRDFDDCATDEKACQLEKTLFKKINALNIGAMGLKGDTTALAVKVNLYPCHIASLPVAVSLMCHASRHEIVTL